MSEPASETIPGSKGKRGSETRWGFLLPLDIGADDDPYLDRLWLIKTPLLSLALHHIHRADKEIDPHDHPWWFASLVLTGAYAETVFLDKTAGKTYGDGNVSPRYRGRFSLRQIRLREAHIITYITAPLWTLVLTGRKRGSWGFYRQGKFIPWREYTYAPKKGNSA